jgi:hypothetical protein
VEISKPSTIGKTHEHRRLALRDQQGGEADALWWNSAGEPLPTGLFDLAYYARRDSYHASNDVILEWADFHEVEREVIDLHQPKSRYHFFDHRFDPDAHLLLDRMKEHPDLSIWGEGTFGLPPYSATRTELKPARKLAILTPPPSPSVLFDGLDKVSPVEVYLFSLASPDDSVKGFLAEVLNFIKKTIQNGVGEISLSIMAGVLGQTNVITWMGLQWFQLRGELGLERKNDHILISRIHSNVSPEIKDFTKDLQIQLGETAAFRNYYLRADPLILLS